MVGFLCKSNVWAVFNIEYKEIHNQYSNIKTFYCHINILHAALIGHKDVAKQVYHQGTVS